MELLLVKIKVSLKSAFRVFINPVYILWVGLGTLITSGFILWSLNLNLLGYVIFDAPISLLQKIDFFFDIYSNLYTTYTGVQSISLVIFSVLFGINLALLIFVLKNRGFSAIPKKSGVGGFALAILGGGCVACGTSLIAPLVATLGAGATPFLRDLATIFNILGSILILYSIYKLGGIASYIFASRKNKNIPES